MVEPDRLRDAALDLLAQCIEGKIDWRAKRQEKLEPLKLRSAIEGAMVFTGAKGFVMAKAGTNYPAPIEAINAMEKVEACTRDDTIPFEIEGFVKRIRYELEYEYEPPTRISWRAVPGPDIRDMEGSYTFNARADYLYRGSSYTWAVNLAETGATNRLSLRAGVRLTRLEAQMNRAVQVSIAAISKKLSHLWKNLLLKASTKPWAANSRSRTSLLGCRPSTE